MILGDKLLISEVVLSHNPNQLMILFCQESKTCQFGAHGDDEEAPVVHLILALHAAKRTLLHWCFFHKMETAEIFYGK
jgi:hypothetical protein